MWESRFWSCLGRQIRISICGRPLNKCQSQEKKKFDFLFVLLVNHKFVTLILYLTRSLAATAIVCIPIRDRDTLVIVDERCVLQARSLSFTDPSLRGKAPSVIEICLAWTVPSAVVAFLCFLWILFRSDGDGDALFKMMVILFFLRGGSAWIILYQSCRG